MLSNLYFFFGVQSGLLGPSYWPELLNGAFEMAPCSCPKSPQPGRRWVFNTATTTLESNSSLISFIQISKRQHDDIGMESKMMVSKATLSFDLKITTGIKHDLDFVQYLALLVIGYNFSLIIVWMMMQFFSVVLDEIIYWIIRFP